MRPEKRTESLCVKLRTDASRPFVIPIFLPHAGCPHQCVFCNQKIITHTSSSLPSDLEIAASVHSWLKYRGSDRGSTQIAFFGGNFLGMEVPDIIRMLTVARCFVRDGSVDGIRFSTRPDTISLSRLDLLTEFPVTTIEIGAQSMSDRVLDLCQRGHTAQDTVQAARWLRSRGYTVGIQMMTGLPGAGADSDIASGRRIADLHPDFVRIYPTVVLDRSPLAGWYRRGEFVPATLAETVSLVKRLFRMFHEARIPVIRMGLQVSADLSENDVIVAGPFHPAFGHLVMAAIYRDRAADILKCHDVLQGGRIWLGVNPRRVSVMRGLKNATIRYLSDRLNCPHVDVEARPELSDHQMAWRITSDSGQAEGCCSIFEETT